MDQQDPKTPETLEPQDIPVDDQGRPLRDWETGEPIQWATKKQRIVAAIAAAVVILITIAYTWSIYTGQLFFH